jgi:hypothetical protein
VIGTEDVTSTLAIQQEIQTSDATPTTQPSSSSSSMQEEEKVGLLQTMNYRLSGQLSVVIGLDINNDFQFVLKLKSNDNNITLLVDEWIKLFCFEREIFDFFNKIAGLTNRKRKYCETCGQLNATHEFFSSNRVKYLFRIKSKSRVMVLQSLINKDLINVGLVEIKKLFKLRDFVSIRYERMKEIRFQEVYKKYLRFIKKVGGQIPSSNLKRLFYEFCNENPSLVAAPIEMLMEMIEFNQVKIFDDVKNIK